MNSAQFGPKHKRINGHFVYRLWIWEYYNSTTDVESRPYSFLCRHVYWGDNNDVPEGFIQLVNTEGESTYMNMKYIARFKITLEMEEHDEPSENTADR